MSVGVIEGQNDEDHGDSRGMTFVRAFVWP